MEINYINEFLVFINHVQNEKGIYIVGGGRYGKVFGYYLNANNVLWNGYIDRCPQYAEADIKKVISYEEIHELNDIFIISSICYKQEMKECLNAKGILDENIITFSCVDIIWEMFSQCFGCYQEYTGKIQNFKNVHLGKRCFVIGNGPSLQIEDLHKLKDEYTFAMNSIYCMYPYTEWRPTYYVAVSSDLFSMELSDKNSFVKVIEGCKAAFVSMLTKAFEYRNDKDMDKVYYIKTCSFENTNKSVTRFSEDCSQYMYCSSTVLYCALQLAVYMGFSDIYLIGVDCSFSKELDEDGSINVNNGTDYNTIIQQHLNVSVMDKFNKKFENVHSSYKTIEEYSVAKYYADTHNIHIYNATRGGKLEVFERVDFDSLI